MKQFLFFFGLWALTLFSFNSSATHLKAGDMTADFVAGYTWRFTLTVYTYKNAVDSNSPLDLKKAEISVNGVLVDSVDRVSRTQIDEDTYKNLFVFDYTFAGPKVYVVSFSEEDRNDGILNINGGSSQVPFYIETYVLVSPLAATDNNTPDLYVPPIDEASVGEVYIHNPGAFDREGDSLSYKLVVPKVARSENVPNYNYPDGVSLNPVTGDLIWDSPKIKGLYNIAFIIEEWREGIRIGFVLRDMQIEVKDSENEPPVVDIPVDTCIISGQIYEDTIFATDPDGHLVNLYAYGGVFDINLPIAEFLLPNPNPQDTPATGLFKWQPNCMHVRQAPYQVVFKAEDIPGSDNPLTDLKSLNIKVLGAPLKEVNANGSAGKIELSWNPYGCNAADKIEIYRKACDSLLFEPQICNQNLPGLYGFEKIDEIPASSVSYIDDENGEGLKQGTFYCYLLKVKFGGVKKGESAFSSQVCAVTNQNAPLPLKVSVSKTDSLSGIIDLSWTKPYNFDSIQYSPPYKYIIKRGTGLNPELFDVIHTSGDLEDTVFTDSLLNTHLPYSYTIEFYDASGFYASSNQASTVNLSVTPGSGKAFLNWDYNVPWKNSFKEHIVYRKTNEDSVFKQVNKVAVTDKKAFNDFGLSSKDTVCYYVETQGEYCMNGLPDTIINRSQEVCIIPVDSTAPCPPQLFLDPVKCLPVEDGSNYLSWIPDKVEPCNPDVSSYNLFFAERENEDSKLLMSTNDTTFSHTDSVSLAGCYEVTALNIYGVESGKSNRVCTDICVDYKLPNLFTPNNDGKNDFFRPLEEPVNVESVRFSVYNRWGSMVYSFSGDPLIRWNGESDTGKNLPDGIYYYSTVINFKRRLNKKDENKVVKGWLQIISKSKGLGF